MKTLVYRRSLNPLPVEGEILYMGLRFSAYGTISPTDGMVIYGPAIGKNIQNKILVFESEGGSTVAPWIFIALRRQRILPLALISKERAIVNVPGVIFSEISMYEEIDHDDFESLKTAKRVRISPETFSIDILE